MTRATLKEWTGPTHVREVQLGPDIDINDSDALSEVLQRTLEESALVKSGQVRKVMQPTSRVAAERIPAQKITRGHATNYDGWSRFEDMDISDDEVAEEEFELVPVSEEQREREALLKQARTNALACREKGA
eukprot:1314432-Pyramimonas_sp.AAC.1